MLIQSYIYSIALLCNKSQGDIMKQKKAIALMSASLLLMSSLPPCAVYAYENEYEYGYEDGEYYENNYEDPYEYDQSDIDNYEYYNGDYWVYFPQYTEDSDWKYTVLDGLDGVCDEKCIQIDQYVGEENYYYTLPSKIEGLPVVSVKGPLCFDRNYSCDIYIPDSIKHFEDGWLDVNDFVCFNTQSGDQYRFDSYYDPKGKNATLALTYVHNRQKIELPESVAGFPLKNIELDSLYGCYDTETLILPDSIEYISSYGYMELPSLKKMKLPSGIKYLPPDMFSQMPDLEEVVLPDDLIFISDRAFSNAPKVELPEDKVVQVIGPSNNTYDPFTFMDPETRYCYCVDTEPDDGSDIKISLIYAPEAKCELPTEYRGLPVEIDLHDDPPNGMPYITIPEGQDRLSLYYGDTKCIKELIVHSKNITIDSRGIPDSSIQTLEFPGSAHLGKSCFVGAGKLNSVSFLGNDADIDLDYCSFYSDYALSTLLFPERCNSLKINTMAFQNTGITSLDFPSGNVEIGESAFGNCKQLKDIIFEDGVKISIGAFKSCQNLVEVTFNGDAEIEKNAFLNCPSLNNININLDSKLDTQPFKGCLALETINGESPFEEDGSLKKKYEDFFRRNFFDAENNGIINQYVQYRVKKMVSETITDDMNDMQKIKALHDSLCDMVYYDVGNNSLPKNHNDASVFLNDSTVCDGYARAMNLLLHEAGIKSCYVSNNDHAWVIVETGGHHFHVDPTWDDTETIIYDWFMRTDDQICDDPDHSTWSLVQPSSLHDFQMTALPECNEKMGDVNNDSVIDGRDASLILYHYSRAAVGGECELDEILADVDFDGNITASDASKVLSIYSAESSSR